jgi:peptidyl-Lys metalloendopeptidase
LSACAGSGDQGTGAPDDPGGKNTAGVTQLGELEFALSVPRPSVHANEPVSVDVTITNVTDHEVRVLRRETPIDGIDEPLFDVKRDGAPVRYVGKIVLWAEPGPDSYLVLKAGESVSKTVDLATAYDISASGEYSVALAAQPDAGGVRVQAEGRAFVVPSANAPTVSDEGDSTIGSTSQALLTGCDAERTDQIRRSWGTARELVYEVNDFLSQEPLNGPRYNTWFGWANEYRWGVVAGRYQNIAYALDYRDVDCSTCTNNDWNAYVYADSPYKIYVCPPFWGQSRTGQAGTIIHELSHFYGTADIVYGESACQDLATNDPISARSNAANYRYFAINSEGLGY